MLTKVPHRAARWRPTKTRCFVYKTSPPYWAHGNAQASRSPDDWRRKTRPDSTGQTRLLQNTFLPSARKSHPETKLAQVPCDSKTTKGNFRYSRGERPSEVTTICLLGDIQKATTLRKWGAPSFPPPAKTADAWSRRHPLGRVDRRAYHQPRSCEGQGLTAIACRACVVPHHPSAFCAIGAVAAYLGAVEMAISSSIIFCLRQFHAFDGIACEAR